MAEETDPELEPLIRALRGTKTQQPVRKPPEDGTEFQDHQPLEAEPEASGGMGGVYRGMYGPKTPMGLDADTAAQVSALAGKYQGEQDLGEREKQEGFMGDSGPLPGLAQRGQQRQTQAIGQQEHLGGMLQKSLEAKRELMALQNNLQNTRFQQGQSTAQLNQQLLNENRVPAAERDQLASFDAGMKTMDNAIEAYKSRPTQFTASEAKAFILPVAAALGPGGQATQDAVAHVGESFPGWAEGMFGSHVGGKTGLRKLETLRTELANKRAALAAQLQGQRFGGVGGGAPSVVEEVKGKSGRIIQKLSDGSHRVKPSGG